MLLEIWVGLINKMSLNSSISSPFMWIAATSEDESITDDEKQVIRVKGLHGPCSVAVTKDRCMVVSEWRGHQVSVITPGGKIENRFGNRQPSEESLKYQRLYELCQRNAQQLQDQLYGSNVGELHEPTSVVVTEDNHILVADSQNRRLQLFTFTGTPVGAVVSSDELKLKYPYDMCIDKRGLIYVTDPFSNCINVLTPELSLSHKFGSETTSKFKAPLGITVDSENMLYVCDSDTSRVLKLSQFGRLLTEYSCDHLRHPVRVAVDSNGVVYVTYSYNPEIAMYTNDGQYIGRFGGDSKIVQSFKRPRGLTIDSEHIYICDSIHNELFIF